MPTVRRDPHPALRPFVSVLWATDGVEPGGGRGAARERVLPTGAVHVVFRGDGDALRIFADVDDAAGTAIGCAIVGGPRARYYVRDVSRPMASVGAMLRPGAAPLLLGVPAGDLADRHVALDDLWGAGAEDERARIMTPRDPHARLDALERILRARLPAVRGVHPAIAGALARLDGGATVGAAVDASGYSHRGFLARFRDAVGLAPKLYSRVRRFDRALAHLAAAPAAPWIEVALAAGYADQPHFVRAFREHTGVAPTEYRALATREAHHVPIPATSDPFKTPGRGPGKVGP